MESLENIQPSPADLPAPEYVCEGNANTWDTWRKTAGLLKHLTRRHLADRYRGSTFGFVWTLVNPILMMCIYGFVFSFLMRTSEKGVPYSCFFLSGYLAWACFAVAVMNAGASVADGGYLIKKTYFPRIVLPLSAILSNSINYLITIPLLLLYNAAWGITPGWNILLLPFAFLLLLLITTGISLIISSIAAFFRDLLELLQILFTAWFFATPILYPMRLVLESDRVSDTLEALYRLNPMLGPILFLQSIFLGKPLPLSDIAYSCAAGLLLFAVGAWVFSRCSPRFSNVAQ